ncbi:MAG: hypothetical protein ABH827_02750, partial [bacterium]
MQLFLNFTQKISVQKNTKIAQFRIAHQNAWITIINPILITYHDKSGKCIAIVNPFPHPFTELKLKYWNDYWDDYI